MAACNWAAVRARGPRGVKIDRAAPARHHESGEEFGAIIVAEEMHHRLRHGGIVGDDGLDFAQFDAEAADLHLRIDAADEFDVAHRVQTHQIARTIDQSRSAVGPIKRRLHEFLGGQVRAADIARPYARPADDQLALGACRHRPQLFIHDPRRIARDRAADGDAAARLHLGPCRRHGGFGRPISVEHPQTRPGPAIDQIGRTGFAPKVEQAQRGHRRFDEGQQRGHNMPDRHRLRRQNDRHVRPRLGQSLIGDQQLRAHEEGAPHGFHRHVEGQAEAAKDLVLGLQSQDRAFAAHQMAGVAMGDHHPLGRPVVPEV
jgi:hypothetical protein